MPGCGRSQIALEAGNVHPLHPQAFENTGLKSRPARSRGAGERTVASVLAQAISAWHAAAAEQRRMEWMAISLPHNSSQLFGRLPFADAIGLAALVGSGRMSWAEVNIALDARIKLAVARRLDGQDAPPSDPHRAWEDTKRTAEDEIWARYHAKCDAVFANDVDEAPTDPWSRDQLRERERILNRLRRERDRALAALDRRMDPPPSHVSSTTALHSTVSAQLRITAAERDALRKLDASGFAGSQLMADAIRALAAPLAAIADFA